MMNIANLTVLVVEDDDFQRKIVVDILNSLGVRSIFSAGNGKQALDIVREMNSRPVDVALCDLNMPEMDGMEFLRHLGEQHRGTAVILISSVDRKVLSSVGRMTEMYGIQLLGIIEKPVLPENLKAHLLNLKAPAGMAQQAPSMTFSLDEILQGIRADQFVPYFQPKVDMKTGRIFGAEALARWLHPTHGVIAPYAFIPLLEKTANIDDLTYCILRKAAAALRSSTTATRSGWSPRLLRVRKTSRIRSASPAGRKKRAATVNVLRCNGITTKTRDSRMPLRGFLSPRPIPR